MGKRSQPTNPGSARESWSRPTARIDWLAGPIMNENAEGVDAADVWLTPPPERCPPDSGFHGYDHWTGDVHGSKLARLADRERDGTRRREFLKTYLILKGSGLAARRAEGLDDREQLQGFRIWGGRCKRIDLAIDVKHPRVTPLALYTLHQRRRFVTRFQEPALWGDRDAGQTFYLLGKDQCFRAYDKSAERERKGVRLAKGITRLEMELRGPWAHRAFSDLAKLLDRPDWDAAFPAFVAGVILAKVRPLNTARPEKNPQRAPVWKPLAEALRDVGPVRLSADELHRSQMQRIDGALLHAKNDLGALALVRRILGDRLFRQVLARTDLDREQQLLAGFAKLQRDEIHDLIQSRGLSIEPTAQEAASDPPDDPRQLLLWPRQEPPR